MLLMVLHLLMYAIPYVMLSGETAGVNRKEI
jgi:hypothetical protein